MGSLPSGTVTFLFTDVEGSTRLLNEWGAEVYARELAVHRRVIREACAAQGGVEVDTQGDAFFVAFPTAPGAFAAAQVIVDKLESGPIAVRVGLHTGTPLLTGDGYVGPDVHRAARIAAAGHGGQILVSASTASLTSVEGLLDLGEHRFKDLSAPERVYQLGSEEYPALKSLYRTNLPIPSTPFLGRERELGEVLNLLTREDVRLLTLTGPGGTGKTRLAAHAAGALAERYPDGVWWVPLAALHDPQLVLETAARVLAAVDGLASRIADTRMLLLFDNFEHLLGAAVELAPLLAACPNLELLVTSRQPLQLSGEQEYAVPPFVHEEAVDFFASRARAVVPDLVIDDAVPQICRRLDDLPLALELAAARVKALSLGQILERLEQRLAFLTGGRRDAPERQQTLRAAIEWSYDLLSEQERRLFAELSAFAGGCTFVAALKIADADLETLQSLVEKSLLRFSNERYSMLETIREFAAEQLLLSSEHGRCLEDHANYFITQLTELEADNAGNVESLLDALEADHANIRASLEYIQHRDASSLLRCTVALGQFWQLRDHLAEGRTWVERALDATDESNPRLRAQALNHASLLARAQGDYDGAWKHAEDGLQIGRATGNPRTAAKALANLATIAADRLEIDQALVLQQEAVDLVRDLEDKLPFATNTGNLGYIVLTQGDAPRAIPLLEEAQRLYQRIENVSGECVVLLNLGAAYLSVGRLDASRGSFLDALRAASTLGSARFVAYALQGVAATIAGTDPKQAADLLGASGRLLDKTGANPEPVERRVREAALETLTEVLGDAKSDALAAGARLEADEAVAQALSIEPAPPPPSPS